MLPVVVVASGWWMHATASRAAPIATRKRASQRQRQQQQPAVRHRSTVRRLVSTSSRRANTTFRLPNVGAVKPTEVPAQNAGPPTSGRRRHGSAGARRRRRSRWSAATAPRTCAPHRGWHRCRFHGGRHPEVIADLLHHPAHTGARSAPRRREMHHCRASRFQPQERGIGRGGGVVASPGVGQLSQHTGPSVQPPSDRSSEDQGGEDRDDAHL